MHVVVDNNVMLCTTISEPGCPSGAAPLGWIVLGAIAVLAVIALGASWAWGQREATSEPPPRMNLDINRASHRELELLPGVGPSRAARIVAAREKRRGFHSLSELDEPGLLGPGAAKRLAPYLQDLPGKPAGKKRR